jgi:hypothetical protein
MVELVQAHTALEEPMETAIWIRPEEREAWLVELIPSLMDDAHPERPVAFNPVRSFRHQLNLIASTGKGSAAQWKPTTHSRATLLLGTSFMATNPAVSCRTSP